MPGTFLEGKPKHSASNFVAIVCAALALSANAAASAAQDGTTTALILEGLSAGTGVDARYQVKVPAGAANLVFSTSGSVGNVDLYVKAGSPPGKTIDSSDCSSYTTTDTEACTIPAPRADTWNILLDAVKAYSGVTLKVTYETPVALTVSKSGSGAGTVQSTQVASRFAAREAEPVPEPRIVGGSYALADSWPWQVQVLFMEGRWCGGSLLSDRWVVTAAHCAGVSPKMLQVRAGSLTSETGGQLVALKRVVDHPQYVVATDDNDIALLELATPVTLSSSVAPIDPVVPADESSLVFDGRLATVTGWGKTSDGGVSSPDLRQVTLPLLTSATCRQTSYGNRITDNMICAGYDFGEKDSCHGDSGGPLAVPNGRGGWSLAGVVSFGEGCAVKGYPGVYTRVANYKNWIESTTGLTFGRPLIDCGGACSARLGLASTVTLAATPDANSLFVGWSGACTGTGPCVVTMNDAQNVSAAFRLKSEPPPNATPVPTLTPLALLALGVILGALGGFVLVRGRRP